MLAFAVALAQASVEAEVQTDALVLGGAEFNRCLAENSTTVAAVMKGLVRRLRSADAGVGLQRLLHQRAERGVVEALPPAGQRGGLRGRRADAVPGRWHHDAG